MDPHHAPDRRQHHRVSLGGSALLTLDPGRAPISTTGQLIDVSRGGCRLQLQRPVEPHQPAQLRLALAGCMQWFPATISWLRRDDDGWTVGCVFEPLSPAMQDALYDAIRELTLT